jgi:tRNA threonylcarbamoyladenosine biosynthesis protein TsaB
MMNTLAIDTSTNSASVALLDDDTIVAEIYFNTQKRHEETLLDAINTLLSYGQVKPSEIGLFAVTVGPGSFTGLRVGLSTAKGLAFAAKKPIVAVSTLMALACNVPTGDNEVCPMLDAKGGQVYAAIYRIGSDGIPEMIGGERVATPEKLLDQINARTTFLGNGSTLYADMINGMLSEKAAFVPKSFNYIRAGVVGLIGLKKYFDDDITQTNVLVPVYLRSSYAESKE